MTEPVGAGTCSVAPGCVETAVLAPQPGLARLECTAFPLWPGAGPDGKWPQNGDTERQRTVVVGGDREGGKQQAGPGWGNGVRAGCLGLPACLAACLPRSPSLCPYPSSLPPPSTPLSLSPFPPLPFFSWLTFVRSSSSLLIW